MSVLIIYTITVTKI